MSAMNKAEAERFRRIQREAALGYGITLKDLGWLVRLVEKLDRLNNDRDAGKIAAPPRTIAPSILRKPRRKP